MGVESNLIREFKDRHIGITPNHLESMLKVLGVSSLDDLIDQTIPPDIRLEGSLNLPPSLSETEAIKELKKIASQNKVFRSYIGRGYYNCITPAVIQRNILENPGWYTAYTPYQAEIAQGRLEALLNFQTLICDLTKLEIANASLLDEGTAAAEAMAMSYSLSKNNNTSFFVSDLCHPQTIDVVMTRATSIGIKVIIGDHRIFDWKSNIFGALLQYPATNGIIYDYRTFIQQAHQTGALVTVAADILSLTLLVPPGEFGADIAVGTTQRLGIGLGYGGPHAAYIATKDNYKRHLPGRIVGISCDVHGNPALRLALQTREQHIRREKATSNICTAQVLLAVMASMYAIYHGPLGLKQIAQKIHQQTVTLATGLMALGYKVTSEPYFDTILVKAKADEVIAIAQSYQINLLKWDQDTIGISLDETTTQEDLQDLLNIFGTQNLPQTVDSSILSDFERTSSYLNHPVFNQYHSETELLRYIHRLETKDLALNNSMIGLGSCTMKLNATSEMLPISWPQFSQIHPFAPKSQVQGYQILFEQLEDYLKEITGFTGISLQPNAGSQGEYAGLLVIRRYHQERQESHRHICLIPASAHGTNPASAVMCGMKVVAVACDSDGNIDLADLKLKAKKHHLELAALMVTYPSTHGVFESAIKEICQIIHDHGGQVYMDGANMNAQVGLCRPADFGADVCHLNLHKTFCIPHGGGGPGVGPIGVKSHLVPFLPAIDQSNPKSVGFVSAAPWGSASILTISWMYIRMMGTKGLTEATKIAILNANYIAHRLKSYYPVLYKGAKGFVAHECILDLRNLKKTAQIEVEDIAKRLMDYGFHAPTVSWPVAGTMMIEPTESESKEELDRFCDAMIAIRQEISEIELGQADPNDNLLKGAPHTALSLITDKWNHSYSPRKAAYPTSWTRDYKFWPSVGRIDNAYGDRNLVCSCLPIENYND